MEGRATPRQTFRAEVTKTSARLSSGRPISTLNSAWILGAGPPRSRSTLSASRQALAMGNSCGA
ncbi:MAG: hypothetical protein ACK56I_28455, partial [bacterium]